MLSDIKGGNNNCLLIENFDAIKSDNMYTNFENEISKYNKLTLVNFIVEYYDKSAILSLLKKYGCIDYFELMENSYKRVLQLKQILDTIEKDNLEKDKIVERLTFEQCNNIMMNIMENNELRGGKPFLKFIKNIFSNNARANGLDYVVPGVILCVLCSAVEYVDHTAARMLEVGFFLIPAVERVIRAWRVRNIPDNVFTILNDLVFINPGRGIRLRQYAMWHIQGIDLLEWIPAFGNQMIPSVFHEEQKTRLRNITTKLNVYRDLVRQKGWVGLARENGLEMHIALSAHRFDVRNNRVNPMQAHPDEPIDYLIIRRASNLPTNIGDENQCYICFEKLIESNPIDDTKNLNGYLVRLHQQIDGVAHLFHFKCIKNWFATQRRNKTTCPLCREDITFGQHIVDENIPDNDDGIGFFDVPSDELVQD